MIIPNKSKIQIFKNADELAQALADDFMEAVKLAARENRWFNIALSGGNTPALFFQKLASAPYLRNIAWQNVHFFWGDERCVPPDHADSNYGMTKKHLFDRVRIPDKNIHRIMGENDLDREAIRYADEITQWVPLNQQGWPVFDWILLGLGSDGHTASIFPGSRVMEDKDNICALTNHPKTGQKRITLTLPVINQAKRVSFLVTGENKAFMVSKIFETSAPGKELPAALVRPVNGILEWYLDQAAASTIRG